MNCLLNWISNNIPETFAIIMSTFSFGFSFWRYKGKLPTISRHFLQDDNDIFDYKARITLSTNSEQVEILDYKLFKKKFLFYRFYKDQEVIEIEIPKEPIIAHYDIDLNTIKVLKHGKYKLKIFINRRPKILKLRFKLPVIVSLIS